MGTPTFPNMWDDVLTQLNTVLGWDIVKGFMVITIAIFLGSIAMSMVSKAMHRG